MEPNTSRTEQEVKADVLVCVYPPSPNDDRLFALPVHSQVLCARSSFFAARLSQQRQSAAESLSSITSTSNPEDVAEADAELFAIDIVVHHSSAASTYKRCIDLMYVRRKDMISCRPFSGVDDALCMLRIATELLFQDCMDACMEFLDMVCSWSPEEEASIRSTLSSLQLARIHPDLARRLSLPEAMSVNEPTLILRRMLVRALQVSTPSEKALENPSKPIPKSSILQAWNTHLDKIRRAVTDYPKSRGQLEAEAGAALAKLVWLFDKLLAIGAADGVVKAFTEDTGLPSAFTACIEAQGYVYYSPLPAPMVRLLDRMVQSVLKGEVLLSQAARLAFIKAWLPLCDTIHYSNFGSGLAPSLMSLADSLPLVDREQLYMEYCLEPDFQKKQDSFDFQGTKRLISSFSTWCDMLRKASHLNGRCGIIVVDDHDA